MEKSGRVLVVGGSPDFVGAPYLAGIAALRSGAESVIVMAPERVAWAINALSPDLMTRKLKGRFLSHAHERTIRKQMQTADVLVLGNGAGIRPETARLMRSLMRSPLLKIIDADALKVLRGSEVHSAILTPNEGEWRALEKHCDIKKLLSRGNIIIKKGRQTRILSTRKTFSIRPQKGLSKAGMGDVLAGMCAGFLACPPKPRRRRARGSLLFNAAKESCRVGNEIARLLAKRKRGEYSLASDIIRELSLVSEKI